MPAKIISFSKSILVGTLKPTGQISLASPSIQTDALFEPSLSTPALTQSKEPVINLSVVEKMLSFCADVVPEVLDS
jgi:hypothetical protein